jgi:hypothetical protein
MSIDDNHQRQNPLQVLFFKPRWPLLIIGSGTTVSRRMSSSRVTHRLGFVSQLKQLLLLTVM